MTDLDDVFVPLALELATEFGTTLTWRKTARVISSDDGTVAETITNYPNVKIFPPSTFDPSSLRAPRQFAAGSIATQGEIGFTLPASGLAFEPMNGDEADFLSVTWTVTGVTPMFSGAEIYAWAGRLVRVTQS